MMTPAAPKHDGSIIANELHHQIEGFRIGMKEAIEAAIEFLSERVDKWSDEDSEALREAVMKKGI